MQRNSSREKANVLYCTPHLNFPPKGGPELRSLNSIKALAGISNLSVVHIVQFGDESDLSLRHELQSLGVSEYSKLVIPRHQALETARYIGFRKIIVRSVNLVFRIISQYSYRKNIYISKQVSILLSESQIDVFWISFANLYVPVISRLRKLKPELKIVSDTDSVWSEFILRSIPHKPFILGLISNWQGRYKRLQEKKMIKESSLVTAVSEVDQLQYQKMTSDSHKIVCAYNVIDLDTYSTNSFQGRKTFNKIILLTGSFGQKYSPMDHGARWFIQDVWPKIKLKEPQSILKIVGKGSNTFLKNNPKEGIIVLGKVDSINPFMSEASVSIVPLWFESGTRFKILESAALFTPVVTTSLGVEGLLVSGCNDILVADTAEDFAAKVLNFIATESAPATGQSMFEIVRTKYSIESLEAQSISILKTLNS